MREHGRSTRLPRASCPPSREPTLSAIRTRPRRRALLLVIGAWCGAALVGPGTGSAGADARGDLEQARAAVDDLAEEWFDAQTAAAELDDRIERLETELGALQATTTRLRGNARVQAAALYEGSSSSIEAETLFEGGSAMDTDRRNELLAAINEQARADIDAHASAAAELRDRLAELDAARGELDATLDRLRDDEAALRRELARAQAAYRAEQEAARAAAAARDAATSVADHHPDPSSGGTDPTDPAPTDPDPGDPPDEPDPVDPPDPPQPGDHPRHGDPFLSCVRQRESRGDYTVVNWDGPWYGAYQFAASTWDATASHAGRPELIGVRPHQASPWDQDDMAWTLYQWQGMGPWGGGCG